MVFSFFNRASIIELVKCTHDYRRSYTGRYKYKTISSRVIDGLRRANKAYGKRVRTSTGDIEHV